MQIIFPLNKKKMEEMEHVNSKHSIARTNKDYVGQNENQFFRFLRLILESNSEPSYDKDLGLGSVRCLEMILAIEKTNIFSFPKIDAR